MGLHQHHNNTRATPTHSDKTHPPVLTPTTARPPAGCTPSPSPRSRAPSAFTGYAFHVAEALLVFANELLLPLMFPIHMGLHRIYHLLTTLIHEGGVCRRVERLPRTLSPDSAAPIRATLLHLSPAPKSSHNLPIGGFASYICVVEVLLNRPSRCRHGGPTSCLPAQPLRRPRSRPLVLSQI